MNIVKFIRRKRITIGDVGIALYLLACCAIVIIPMIHIIAISFSDATRIVPGLTIIPEKFSMMSYEKTFGSTQMWTGLKNSVIIVCIMVPVSVMFNAMCAFATSKEGLPGSKFLRLFFVILMYFGAGMIPSFLTMNAYGLVGTFFIYFAGWTSPYWMILTRNYMAGIAASLEEAALLDGANYWTYFLRICIPVSLPILATFTLFSFVGTWNGYTSTLIYNLTKPENYTLQYVLYLSLVQVNQELGQEALSVLDFSEANSTTMRCALTVVTLVPVTIVYPFLQKYIISGITLGAVKE